LAAEIPADRRTLPVDRQVAGILGVERAFAEAHAGKERTAGFLAQHIAVRLAPLAHRLLDDGGKPARDRTEEPMAGIDEFSRQVGAGWRRWRRLRGQGSGAKAGEEKGNGDVSQDGAHPRLLEIETL